MFWTSGLGCSFEKDGNERKCPICQQYVFMCARMVQIFSFLNWIIYIFFGIAIDIVSLSIIFNIKIKKYELLETDDLTEI